MGNVGEVLRATGNPIYDPRRCPGDLLRALTAFDRATAAELGRRNRHWLQDHGSYEQIADAGLAIVDERIERTGT
ncbi:hypothetical protein D3C83_232070 [compost metagenome]